MTQKPELFTVAEIELQYKTEVKARDRPQMKSSKTAYEIFMQAWSDNIELYEEFCILLLNRSNRILGIVHISKGGTSGTVVDAKMIFAAALKANASSVILGHNHPSGNLNPSQADIDITRKLRRGGELLDIAVLDHLILTKEGYYSFADEGKM